jgi:hypothetical protein
MSSAADSTTPSPGKAPIVVARYYNTAAPVDTIGGDRD